jgi:hypothetical protein
MEEKHGLAITVFRVLFAIPITYLLLCLLRTDKGTHGTALAAIGLLLVGYVAFLLIGLLAEQAISAFIKDRPQLNEF